MSILKKSKKELITEFASAANDTGSTEVQCALITKQIENLSEHLKINKKDVASKRGLIILVGQRKRLLKYLKSSSVERYETLIKKLDIRK